MAKKYSNLFTRKFDMSGDHSKITIWKSYHDESQIDKYKLFENERIYLFNCANTGYLDTNVNTLNQIICEGCCLLYPYLNNMKSDIIGFQHYRRCYKSSISDIMQNDIINGKIQIFFFHHTKLRNKFTEKYINIANHFYYWGCFYNGFYNDFIEYLLANFPEYLSSELRLHVFSNFCIFASNWENYVKLAKLLWGYFNFIADKYKFNILNDNDWAEFINERFIKFNKENDITANEISNRDDYIGFKTDWKCPPYKNKDSFKYSLYRIFSFHVEFIVSMWAYHHGTVYDDHNKIIIQK